MARRFVLAAIAATGCAFTGQGGSEPGPAPYAGAVEPLRTCKAPPADVRLCIDFEDSSLAQRALDGSGGLNDAIATAITPLQRLGLAAPEQAAQLSQQSTLHVAETPALDLATLTIEMWIRPDALPPQSTVAGLVDNYGLYSMQLTPDGRLRCALDGSSSAESRSSLVVGAWRHVACRYDGYEMRAYVDGAVAECNQLGPAVSDPIAGTAIGSRIVAPVGPAVAFRDRFVGGIDNVRVYNGAIEEQRLCAAAGKTTCSFSCPSHEDHGGHYGGD